MIDQNVRHVGYLEAELQAVAAVRGIEVLDGEIFQSNPGHRARRPPMQRSRTRVYGGTVDYHAGAGTVDGEGLGGGGAFDDVSGGGGDGGTAGRREDGWVEGYYVEAGVGAGICEGLAEGAGAAVVGGGDDEGTGLALGRGTWGEDSESQDGQ